MNQKDEGEFIYHYYATRHSGGREDHIDGIAGLKFLIRTMEDYHQLKQVIAETVEGRGDTEGLTICSLSVLSRREGRKPLTKPRVKSK